MPRIRQNKMEYLKADLYRYMWGEMKDQGITQTQLAEQLDISRSRLSVKMRTGDFKFAELSIIFNYLGVPNKDVLKLLGVNNG